MSAPEKIWLDWRPGAAITSGPLTTNAAYTAYVRADVLPKVKPLEWENLGGSYRARAPLFGNIRVENYSTDFWSVHWSAPGFTDLFVSGAFNTPDEAKAAAQSNYAARLLAALEPQ